MNDPIVDEIRRIRDAHAASFNYDLDAIYLDLKEREKQSGRKFVSFGIRDINDQHTHRESNMHRLYVPTFGTADWRRLLANPERHWKRKHSALEMAVCWEAARKSIRGLPQQVANTLDTHPDTIGAELLIAFPEHKVSFAGGGHASQNDLWALLKKDRDSISMTIEAKAGEKLDDLVIEWLKKQKKGSGKPARLNELKQLLAITDCDVNQIRYQLLHRTASAIKEAVRFNATKAIMLIQSFNKADDELSWNDFKDFGKLMGATVQEDTLVKAERHTDIPLYLGWVNSETATTWQLAQTI